MVIVDDLGLPSAIVRGGNVIAVTQLQELWRVAEAWWRTDALTRTYVRLLLHDGQLLTLFHDDEDAPDDGWHEQRY